MSADEKLIVFVDKDGNEKVLAMDWRKRRVAALTVSFSPAVEERQVERLLHGLSDGLAGTTVAIGHAETEDEFLIRHADAIVPADAKDSRVVTRAQREAEVRVREAAAATILR